MREFKSLIRAKKIAHYHLDSIWKRGIVTRTEAYVWLAEKMHMSLKDCHIAKMNKQECERVVELIKEIRMEKI